MFRPVLAALLALVVVSVAGCAGSPAPAAKSPAAASAATQSAPDGKTAVEIPAPAGTPTDPTIRSGSAATCRADCDRSYRTCGEGSGNSGSMNRLDSLTNPRLFSRGDNCRYSLERCLTRCNKVP
jgi:hypothetical protein